MLFDAEQKEIQTTLLWVLNEGQTAPQAFAWEILSCKINEENMS